MSHNHDHNHDHEVITLVDFLPFVKSIKALSKRDKTVTILRLLSYF